MFTKIKVFIALLFLFSLQLSSIHALDSSCDKYNLALISKDINVNYNFLIVLTIDSTKNKLKLTSISNDYIVDNENDLLSLLKNKLNINIDGYVVIDKVALEKIISSINGIYIDNYYFFGNDFVKHLDCIDFDCSLSREKFQVNLIQEILYSFSRTSFCEYPSIIKNTFPYVKLNITPTKMLSLGFSALGFKDYKALQIYIN